jgi:hypothetical protein
LKFQEKFGCVDFIRCVKTLTLPNEEILCKSLKIAEILFWSYLKEYVKLTEKVLSTMEYQNITNVKRRIH